MSSKTEKFILRAYQAELKTDVYAAWEQGHRNVLAQSPTGSGKTVVFADILHDFSAPSCVLAHRSEIIGQISLALAKQGVTHRIIAPDKLRKYLEQLHATKLGRSFVDQNARCAVGSVQTITSKSRRDNLKDWCDQVQLWVQDEAHHVLSANQWGKAIELFPNAKGLGVTATPCRADGKGLGREYDGVFDTIVTGKSMRWLIDNGHLSEYKIFAPATDIDFGKMKVGATGDYTDASMKKQVRRSPIVGDVVAQYMRLALGKLNVVFATDVETAGDFVAQFQEMGVPAALVTAKTPERIRREIIDRFARRELLVLVNVDLFGEGFDLPKIEVVSMARPTASFSLFCQQFGRALRPMEGKTHAIIIDHVGNCMRHGLPDAPREWSLEPRDKKTRTTLDPNLIPLKTCLECAGCYEAVLPCCPYCTHINEITDRSRPQFVDGDLTELSEEAMRRLRGIIAKKDTPSSVIAQRMQRDHVETGKIIMVTRNIDAAQASQRILRANIETWAKLQRCLNRDDSEIYKRFYWKFGTDVLSAQILGRADADLLNEKIKGDMLR